MPRKNKKGRGRKRPIKFLGIVNTRTRSTLKWKTFTRAEEQNWRCYYCQCRMVPSEPGIERENAATGDHKVPRAKGGSSHIDNIVAACNRCNSLKRTMSEEQFKEFLKTCDPQ